MAVKFFGQYLLDKKLITENQLQEAVDFQKKVNLKLGEIAIRKGILTAEQVKSIHSKQKNVDKFFGAIALKLKLLTDKELYKLLELQKNNNIHIGQALLNHEAITGHQFNEELSAFKKLQSESGKKSLIELNKSSQNETLKTFIYSTAKILYRIAGICGKIFMSFKGFNYPSFYEWNISGELKGDFCGTYYLSISKEVAREIAVNMFGVEPENEKDYEDIIIEFVNIAVGNAINFLNPKKIEIMPVKIIKQINNLKTKSEDYKLISTKLITPVGGLHVLIDYLIDQ